jgi:hypothetical protein
MDCKREVGKHLVSAFLTTAFGAAVPLVLAESAVVLFFLSKTFLLGPLGTDLFDAVSCKNKRAFLHADL